MSPQWVEMSEGARRFIRTLARGEAEGVRVHWSNLDERTRAALRAVEEIQVLLARLDAESEWIRANMFLPLPGRTLHPGLKALRLQTQTELGRVRQWARSLIRQHSCAVASPRMNGRHYIAAVAFADYLSPIPGLLATVLFGSVARGEEKDDSDIDLMLVHSPSLTKHRFDQAVRDRLEPLRDCPKPLGSHVHLKPGTLGLDNPPPFHLLRRTSIPRQWEDAGLDGDAVRILWSINSAADLVERRRRGKPFAVRTYKDGAAIVWHSGPPVDSTKQGDVGQSPRIYEATATVEVWADCTLYIGQAKCVVHQRPGPNGPLSLATAGFSWRGRKTLPTRMKHRIERLLEKWTDAVITE